LGLLKWLKQLVMELERPEPLSRLPDVVSRAMDEYAEDSPRLYRVHKEYFDVVRSSLDEVSRTIEELWRRLPYGGMKSVYICFPNKLSNWTDICIRIRSAKHKGEIGIETITIDKMYRPQKYATHMVYLKKPSREELEEGLRRLVEEASKRASSWAVE